MDQTESVALRAAIAEIKPEITRFNSEIRHIKKQEPRQLPDIVINRDTCIDSVNKCIECIAAIERLNAEQPDDVYELDLQTITFIMGNIETYLKELTDTPTTTTEITPPKPVLAEPPETIRPKVRISSGNSWDNQDTRVPEVKSTINEHDSDGDDILQVKEQLIPEVKPEPVIKPAKEVVEEATEQLPVTDAPKEDDNTLTVVEPVNKDELDIKVAIDDKYEEDDIGDDYFSNNKPSIMDDDDDTDASLPENIDDIPIITEVEAKAEDDRENDLYAFNHLPDGLEEHSIKLITRNKTNKFKSRLQGKNIGAETIQTIRMFPYDDSNETLKKEYYSSQNDMLASPRKSRVGLLMSGYFIEMASYGNWDTITLQRSMDNPSYSFVDKEIAILNFIYEHIKYFSYTATRPEFDDWLDTVKYPDYESLFYALYDANSFGMNSYTIDCPFCEEEGVTIARENKDLVVAIEKGYSEEELDKLITTKEMYEIDDYSHLPRWARTTRVRKMPSNTKILFEYKVPSLRDYIVTLSTLRRILVRDKRTFDFERILVPGSDEYLRFMIYLYTGQIGLPSPVFGDPNRPKEPTSYKYIGITNKADIIEVVNSLDVEDYANLFNGKDIIELLTKHSTDYYIKDGACPKCGKTIKYIALDPRKIFFFKIGEAVHSLTVS